MKTGVRVSEAMTEKPITVDVKSKIDECARTMKENHVGALLVTDMSKGNMVVGIVTEQDIVRKAVLADRKPSETEASEIMETGLIKIDPNADIREALESMGSANIRHLPVFNNGSFIGLLTTKDILKIQPQLFEILAQSIELREENRKPINNIHDDEGICELCGNYSTELQNIEGSMSCSECKNSNR